MQCSLKPSLYAEANTGCRKHTPSRIILRTQNMNKWKTETKLAVFPLYCKVVINPNNLETSSSR